MIKHVWCIVHEGLKDECMNDVFGNFRDYLLIMKCWSYLNKSFSVHFIALKSSCCFSTFHILKSWIFYLFISISMEMTSIKTKVWWKIVMNFIVTLNICKVIINYDIVMQETNTKLLLVLLKTNMFQIL